MTMRLPALDDRLAQALAFFPVCEYGADIGADHGRLSCALLAKGICRRMCVSDISGESLEKARGLLALHGLAQRADFRVGDGLDALPRAAQAVAILGMGGHTLSQILLKGQGRLKGAALVLSAHTQLPLVRRTLMEMEYHIDAEQIAQAGGRFYVVLRALPGAERYDQRQLFLGPRLTEGCCAHYRAFLSWRIGVTACMRTADAAQEFAWLKEEEERVRYGWGD